MKRRMICRWVAMVCFVALFMTCSPASKKEIAEYSGDTLEEILEKYPGGSADLRKSLLRYHLQQPEENGPLVYLARERLGEGRLAEAGLYLESSRRRLTRGVSAEDLGLLWYLSAYHSYLNQGYSAALSFLEKYEESAQEISGQNRALNSDSDLADRAVFLKAKSLLSLDEADPAAVDLLLGLWNRKSGLMDQNTRLLLAGLLLRADADSKDGRSAEMTYNSSETVRRILQESLSGDEYDPRSSRIWTSMCLEAGLDETAALGELEYQFFNAGGEFLLSAYSAHIGALAAALETGEWGEVKAAGEELMAKGNRHRLLPFLVALSDLETGDPTTGDLNAYREAGQSYYNTQLYYRFLWRAADRKGERYAPLLKEALNATILLDPSNDYAGEARRRLAEEYGIDKEAELLPLTETEMRELVQMVREGAPARLLDPMIGFLSWPENPCTLQAGVLLRQVRDMPGVRQLLQKRKSLGKPRSAERIKAILQL